jgi:serine protease inhibitor ecotin
MRADGRSYPREEVVAVRSNKGQQVSRDDFVMEKKEKYESSPIVIYFSLVKVSDRIWIATETIDKAICIPIIGNK